MTSAEGRLNQSILKKEILKELNFLLENEHIILEINSIDYYEYVDKIKNWMQENGAYESNGRFDEEFLASNILFKNVSEDVLEAAKIIVSDNYQRYWKNAGGTKSEIWRVCLAIVGLNKSSRQAITKQGGFAGFAGRLNYIPEDWNNFIWLCINKPTDAVVVVLDMLSVLDPTGVADLIAGTLQISQGDLPNGILQIIFGTVQAASLAFTIATEGAAFPSVFLAKAAKTAVKAGSRDAILNIIKTIVEQSPKIIKAAKSSKIPKIKETGDILTQVTRRANQSLTKGIVNGQEKQTLEYILGGAVHQTRQAFPSPKLDILIDALKKEVKPGIFKTPMQGYFFTQTIDQNLSPESRKQKENILKIRNLYYQVCKELPKACTRLNFDESSGEITIKPESLKKERENAERSLLYVKSQIEDKLQEIDIYKK
jgi:hypothetical protein